MPATGGLALGLPAPGKSRTLKAVGFNGAGGLAAFCLKGASLCSAPPTLRVGPPGHRALGPLGSLMPALWRPKLTRGTTAGSHRDFVGIGDYWVAKVIEIGTVCQAYSYPQANVALTLWQGAWGWDANIATGSNGACSRTFWPVLASSAPFFNIRKLEDCLSL